MPFWGFFSCFLTSLGRNVFGLGRFNRCKLWCWELIQDNSPSFQSPCWGDLFHCAVRQAQHNPKGDSFYPLQWWSGIDFLECWTPWFDGVLNSIVGLQNTQVLTCSLFFSFLTSLSTSVQGSVDFSFHRLWGKVGMGGSRSGPILHPWASDSYTTSRLPAEPGLLGMQITELAQKSKSQILWLWSSLWISYSFMNILWLCFRLLNKNLGNYRTSKIWNQTFYVRTIFSPMKFSCTRYTKTDP